MNKEDIKAALTATLRDHEIARQAVAETTVTPGLEGIFAAATTAALNARLAKIFSPRSAAPGDYVVASASSPDDLARLVTARVQEGYGPIGGVQVSGQPAQYFQALLR